MTVAESVVEGTPRRGMARHQSCPHLEALRKLEARLKADLCAHAAGPGGADSSRTARQRFSLFALIACLAHRAWFGSSRLRHVAMAGGAVGAVVLIAMTALWWRLSSGPISLDVATPWLTAAIKENLGAGHDVEIGGTLLERDATGRVELRIRDIVVRDADGTVVASAPKAEVGISGWALFTGRIRAERLSLVGAEMAVRIESDSQVTVFAGGNKRPLVTASTAAPASARGEAGARNAKLTPPCLPGSRASTPAASMAATSPRSGSRAATSPSTISATASTGPSPTSISA
jgi:hypothetical protein